MQRWLATTTRSYSVQWIFCILNTILLIYLLTENPVDVKSELTARKSVVTRKSQFSPYSQPSSQIHPTIIPQKIQFCDHLNPFPYVFVKNSNQSFRTPIVFLKVHKCGSTFFKIFLERYEIKYGDQVSVVHPSRGPWIGGYPGSFQSKFSQELHEIQAGNDRIPVQSMSGHLRWNLPELNKIYKHHPFFKVAIVRNPLSQWVSGYNYFYGQFKEMKEDIGWIGPSCRGSPFKDFVEAQHLMPGTASDSSKKTKPVLRDIKKFVKTIQDSSDFKDFPWGFRAVNHQAYDFGFDVNQPYSENEIREHLQNFDLIIILEKMTESLILLKNLMCLNYEDINLNTLNMSKSKYRENRLSMNLDLVDPDMFTYQRPNQTHYDLDEKLQTKMEEKLLFNDLKIYKIALEMHEQHLQNFGRDLMNQEILKMREITAKNTEIFVGTRSKPSIFGQTKAVKSYTKSEMEKYMRENGVTCKM